MYLKSRDASAEAQSPSPSPSADPYDTRPASTPHSNSGWPLYLSITLVCSALVLFGLFLLWFKAHKRRKDASVKSKAENAEPEPLPLYQYRASEPPPYGAAAGDGVAPPAYDHNGAPGVRQVNEIQSGRLDHDEAAVAPDQRAMETASRQS